MSEMIDRVAKAIEDADANGFSKLPYEAIARVAIEAMREPTVDMLAAAYRAVGVPEKPILRYAFNAMIDQAGGRLKASEPAR